MSYIVPHNITASAADYKILKVSSPAFKEGKMIPAKFTCDGGNISPPIDIESVPPDAKCLALLINDPDTVEAVFTHWIVWNIPVTHHIKENEIHGIQGINDFGQVHYNGPCPDHGTHRYVFKVYALDRLLDLSAEATRRQFEQAMSEHIIAFGELIGLYKTKVYQPGRKQVRCINNV